MTKIVECMIGLAVLGQSGQGWAEPRSKESGADQAAYGAGSVLGTLVYAPVKASFCILGASAAASPSPSPAPRRRATSWARRARAPGRSHLTPSRARSESSSSATDPRR